MSILCQFPDAGGIGASGKLQEELKMFLSSKGNGGRGSKQESGFTDKPIVSMQSAPLYYRDRKREPMSFLIFLRKTNKTTQGQMKTTLRLSCTLLRCTEVLGATPAGQKIEVYTVLMRFDLKNVIPSVLFKGVSTAAFPSQFNFQVDTSWRPFSPFLLCIYK